jgi:glucose/arabinose dehydrogenase
LIVSACAGPATPEASAIPITTSPVTTSAQSDEPTSIVTSPTTTLPELSSLQYTSVASDLPFPVLVTARPGEGVAYVATKDGQVWEMPAGGGVLSPVPDITDRVRDSGEQGLLGMALHPVEESRVFLHYSAGDGDTVLAEYRVDAGMIDPASEQVIFRLDQPAANHNGGMIAFAPDGGLYLGLGDGGGAGDTFGTGQTTDDLLANLLRFDVDDSEQPEVWAIGLRNPWRFWFDRDLIYIGDVGQDAFEEIDVAPATLPGLNYGWSITEGLHCFRPAQGCDTSGLTAPVVEIEHGDAGTCSVTGGVVYRGKAIPELDGHYFYSDYCGGWLRSFKYENGAVTEERDWTAEVGVPGQVTSFGVDGAGEMYVTTTDSVYRVEPVRGT